MVEGLGWFRLEGLWFIGFYNILNRVVFVTREMEVVVSLRRGVFAIWV